MKPAAQLNLPERPAALHLLAVLDVLVLVLVLFLLVTSVAQEAGFPVDIAESNFRLSRVDKTVMVTAKGGMQPIIYVNRTRGTLQDLEENLETARDDTGADTVLVKADKQLTQEVWMSIMNTCHKLGMRPMAVGKLPAGNPATAPEASAPPSGETPPSNGPPTP